MNYDEKIMDDSYVDVYVDTDRVITGSYMGLGVQWDPSDSYSFDRNYVNPNYPDLDLVYTEKDWDMFVSRVDYMKPGFLRVMITAYFYWDGSYDDNGKPVLNYESEKMQRLYKILDYCESRAIPIVLGEWCSPKRYGIMVTDKHWPELICDYLDYLTKQKKYRIISYYNFCNEPNDGENFHDWSIAAKNIRIEFDKRGYSNIGIVGPDAYTHFDYWLGKTVMYASELVGAYDLHYYPDEADVAAGEIERIMKEYAELIVEHDANGSKKPFFIGECGLISGKTPGNDQQPGVREYNYGVTMADYVVQTMKAGMEGVIAWDLDDSMHNNNNGPDPTNLKTWGFFNAVGDRLGDKTGTNLRPWFYTWSLISRSVTKGAVIYATSDPKLSGFRAIASKDINGDFSIILVNNSDTKQALRVFVPQIRKLTKLKKYVYQEDKYITDSNGFPVENETLETTLDSGLSLTCQRKSVTILTSIGTGVTPHISSGEGQIPKNIVIENNKCNTHGRWKKPDSSASIIAVNPIKLFVMEGKEPVLPYTIKTFYSNGQTAFPKVIWNIENHSSFRAGESYKVFGRITGSDYSVCADVTVVSFVDDIENLNEVYSQNGNFFVEKGGIIELFEGKNSRVKRKKDTEGVLIYKTDGITSFNIKIFYQKEYNYGISALVSNNGITWRNTQLKQDVPVLTEDDWYGMNLFSSIEGGKVNYLKICVTGSIVFSPMIGQVSFMQ